MVKIQERNISLDFLKFKENFALMLRQRMLQDKNSKLVPIAEKKTFGRYHIIILLKAISPDT